MKHLRVGSGTTVAFQGELGAFSQEASRKIFGTSIKALPCMTFDDVFEAVAGKNAELAVIPIENSLAGSIHQNFDLLSRHSLEAIAETYVRIEHNLIAHPGTSLAQIRQVYSHPVALAQCQRVLRRMKKVEKVSFYDTAGSVKYISESGLRAAAAIASGDAARIYGLKILARGIEDDPENFTRFLALARRGRFTQGGGKTSIVFGLKNEPGALFKALSVFALRNIDLTKIESRPIHGKPWEYLFYLDLQSNIRSRECSNALRHLREMTLYFRVLGSYPTF
ncbi:MAG TPA: prephenate dehydratase [Acidobacteriota bacterium]|nr:prephenate dehydratase [Acidobacteriota bacterium]